MPGHKSDILYFANMVWNHFQRPHSLLVELAKRGHRTFYIEPMLSLGSVVRNAYHLQSLRFPASPYDRVTLLRPQFSLSTFRFGLTEAIDRKIFVRWFKKIVKSISFEKKPSIFLSLPYWWRHMLDPLKVQEFNIIYDCIDNCQNHSRKKRILNKMEEAEIRLAQEADICLATSDVLFKRIKKINPSTHRIPNAVDPDFFSAYARHEPDDMKFFEKPILGFIGSLYHHVDFTVFEKLSHTLKKGTIVLVGYTNRGRELKSLTNRYDNIRFLGPRSREQVPGYIKTFDVCLNPFTMDELSDSINPLKIYEYLIMGKPVICAKTEEMTKYGRFVYLYENDGELRDASSRALMEKNPDLAEARKAYARENSWKRRVDQIEEILDLA